MTCQAGAWRTMSLPTKPTGTSFRSGGGAVVVIADRSPTAGAARQACHCSQSNKGVLFSELSRRKPAVLHRLPQPACLAGRPKSSLATRLRQLLSPDGATRLESLQSRQHGPAAGVCGAWARPITLRVVARARPSPVRCWGSPRRATPPFSFMFVPGFAASMQVTQVKPRCFPVSYT